MKRNTALFGASLVAGVLATGGLIATGTSSSAATGTYYGVAWADATTGQAHGWTTGKYHDPYGYEFSGSATAGSGTFKDANGGTITVSAKCSGSNLITTANGKTFQPGQTATLGSLAGKNAIGTVTFGSKKVGGHTVGAYIDLSSAYGPGTYVALTGADCAAAPTSTPPTSTNTGTSTSTPTGTTTSTGTSTGTPTGTSTGTPTGTSTGTPTATSTGTSPGTPTAPPPTTEPPTPTPTTTTLPVTG